jgi:pimeloyl-ACP methyl ester carboxylesterase
MRDEHPLPGTDHLVGGVRLHVVHYGTGTGLPLLLLHGIPTWSYLWRDVQRDLGHQHPTYAPDLVGFGSSERPAHARYDLASQARLLLDLLDDLGLDKVGLVGHDVGGGVAVHLTATAPDRVAALVLIDTPLYADTWPVPSVVTLRTPVLGEVQTALLRLAPPAAERYLGMQLARGLRNGPPSARVVREYAAPLLSRDGVRGLLRFTRALDPPAVEQAFAIVRADPPPALVVWGEGDVWQSAASGRRIAADLPGSSYVCVPEAGHFLPEDRPERVAEEIAGFLAELPARRP